MEHTRADTLVAIVEHLLASGDSAGALQALKGSERWQVVLHVDIHTLRQQQADQNSEVPAANRCCGFEHKQWLSPATARRLSCDATLVTLLEDENGQVLNIGHRARTVPDAMRRALIARDHTCRFPGCCEACYVDAHHIQHWAHGGETRLDNLVLVCRFHHHLLHRGIFHITAVANSTDGRPDSLVFSTPDGKVITRSLYPQFPDVSAETPQGALRVYAPEVSPHTCVPRWQSENCDYAMAVDGLLSCHSGWSIRTLSP